MVELEDAQRRLADIKQDLIDAHTAAAEAWETFVKEHPSLALPCDSTTRANFLHNHISSQVARRVGDRAQVEIADCLGFFALRVGHDILLRFKFVGQGQPSNVATDQQKYLARQHYTEDMTLALNGDSALTPPTLLTCGYTLDGEQIGRIEIRRDCKGHLPWMYDIYGGDRVVRPTQFDGMQDDTRPATIRKTTEPKEGDTGADQSESA
jgi:hypothetical protein